ncbi:MAG: LacI family DNA-binding transcriptional regulator [Verrucomicrobia bacterium]|nr:LacI family DNA-binding transcriptional regulator [Verrucomicrobiota bacterium]
MNKRLSNHEPLKRPTFADIAKEAGVCKATVSLALRNNPRISSEMRERIKTIADDMGYRLNPLVTANMAQVRRSKNWKGKMPTIGLLTTFYDEQREEKRVEWHIQSRFLEGAKQRAEKLGFDFDFLEFDLAYYSSDRIQQVLVSRNVSGLVLAPLRFSNSILNLDWSEFAVASIGFTDALGNIPSVFYDNFRCMQDILDFLSHRGYRRIGFITDSENETRGGHLWNAGFLEYQDRVLEKSNRVPIMRIPKPELLFERSDFEAMHRWYKQNKPDVVIAFRSKILDYFQSLGYKVPEDFGYMVLNWSYRTDGCSGYRQCHEEMGEVAVNIVSERLYNNDRGELSKPRTTLLRGDFVDGFTIR